MCLLWIIFNAIFHIAICSNLNTSCDLSNTHIWTCDNVPMDIPHGINRVHIKYFMNETTVLELNFTLFLSDSWKTVKHLEFSDAYGGVNTHITFADDAFRELQGLEILEIHVESKIYFQPFSLLGLRKVTILDLSGCIRLNLDEVTATLNGSEKVPNLKQLLLSSIGYLRSALTIDAEFSNALSQKPIVHLDLSKTRISVLKFNIMKDLIHLKILNISQAVVSEIKVDGLTPEDFKHIDILDMSHTIASKLWQQYKFQNVSLSNANIPIDIQGRSIRYFFYPTIVNISGILGYEVFIYNTKLRNGNYFKSILKELIMMDNHIRRFDIAIECENLDFMSIKLFNLANNGLEYMHPSMFDCMTNLEHLYLSNNKLNVMYEENIHLFNQLLKSSGNLQQIQLASNEFTKIPKDFFAGNVNLEIINLAGNRLTQVHFALHYLPKLRILNISKNRIKILDEISRTHLDAISRTTQYDAYEHTDINITVNQYSNYGQTTVDIKFNPLLCDGCETLYSVRWFLKTGLMDTLSENMTCKGVSGKQVNMNEEAAIMVKDMCDRITRNVALISIAAIFIVMCTSVSYIIYIKRKNRYTKTMRNDIINMLRNREDRFFVFLSYSSEDVDFVTNNVIEPLNEGLRRIIGTRRNLVCRGDTEFRPGQQLFDEFLRCIEKSSVFMSIISNHYCNSEFCKEELNQAKQTKTPVLLMMKGEVDVSQMTPSMKSLFRNNVRILWENNHGEYRLKSSWENVCESILNIAANRDNAE